MRGVDPVSTTRTLVAEDEELVALLRQAENILGYLADSAEYSAEHDAEPWDLPDPFADRAALDAFGRVWDALAAVLDELRPGQPAGPRLLGPDGRYEHMPVRLAELDQADLETLAAAVTVANRALSVTALGDDPQQRRQLRDLAKLLGLIEVDTDLWPLHAAPTTAADLLRPLARLVAVLDLPADADTAALVAALGDRAGDVVLTPSEEAAYRRLTRRWNLLLTDANPLHRYLY